MPKKLSVVSIPLGLTGLDPVSCLERLCPVDGQGFVIEKNEDGRRRAWIGVRPYETLRVHKGRLYSHTRAAAARFPVSRSRRSASSSRRSGRRAANRSTRAPSGSSTTT
ncbi:MAG: hypothetical protein M0D55_18530 [Elusimicrobiota bacterium]|nr:MAG: hypothetical protein M0D55_18530 [Elusimicrobiota bacterium]